MGHHHQVSVVAKIVRRQEVWPSATFAQNTRRRRRGFRPSATALRFGYANCFVSLVGGRIKTWGSSILGLHLNLKFETSS
ncbi:hypothetical protein HanRHA438_Chr07g0302541 [Helianthus annuus]|nr:hypothetical protein HanIR_Chr07g0315111 [Helianthus annuus]KAJ0907733.1 hypothetical protein HanRHA438_Chr07g0302541 [Helianthus annuus]